MPASSRKSTRKSTASKRTGGSKRTSARAKSSARTRTRSKAKTAAARSKSTTRTRGRTRTSLDAVALLKNDHRMMEGLFRKFESTRNARAKGRIRDDIVKELSIHASIEEELLYPAADERARQKGLVLESLEEHHLVKVLLAEIDGMNPEDERFEAKVHVLMENVMHHAKEEEKELLPKVRRVLSRSELIELGEQMEQAKKRAPTRPHPKAPDTPPGIQIAGPVSAVMDSVKDVVRDTRQAVGDAVRGEEPVERQE
ncbi:MAG TPA: hemerythrin domain-containing protein [Actinomycetota bacterium]|nr:hemerythrin domain-containing protein [Actinomycetota bacterium]